MAEFSLPNSTQRPRESSQWACALAALLVACLGLTLAVVITMAGRPQPASVPVDWPAVSAAVMPALPAPPAVTQAPAFRPTPLVTPVPAPATPEAESDAVVDEA